MLRHCFGGWEHQSNDFEGFEGYAKNGGKHRSDASGKTPPVYYSDLRPASSSSSQSQAEPTQYQQRYRSPTQSRPAESEDTSTQEPTQYQQGTANLPQVVLRLPITPHKVRNHHSTRGTNLPLFPAQSRRKRYNHISTTRGTIFQPLFRNYTRTPSNAIRVQTPTPTLPQLPLDQHSSCLHKK